MTSKQNSYIIYCDGASKGNPGPAGWGAVIVNKSTEEMIQRYGSIGRNTNQVAELSAAINAIEFLPTGSTIELFADSKYLVDGMNSWVANWKRNGWKTAAGKPVANRELWEHILVLTRSRNVKFRWVKGHNGHEMNELADNLANQGVTQSSPV